MISSVPEGLDARDRFETLAPAATPAKGSGYPTMHDESITSMVRRYADGEMSPAETAAFETRLIAAPELATHVEFERRLRKRVKAIMQDETGASTSAPPALVARVRDAMAAADAPGDEAAAAGSTPRAPVVRTRAAAQVADGPRDTGSQPHKPSKRKARPQASIFMIAATLTLVGAAVLVGIFGPSIDEMSHSPDLVSEAANWASSEHIRCAGDSAAALGKVASWEVASSRERLAEHLGVSDVTVPLALSAIGYEFTGAGPCEVPAGGLPSGHMIFRRPREHVRGPAMLSVFVAPDVGQYDGTLRFGMVPGKWYTADGGPHCVRTIRRITDGEVVYLLVCCDEGDLDLAEKAIALQLQGVR